MLTTLNDYAQSNVNNKFINKKLEGQFDFNQEYDKLKDLNDVLKIILQKTIFNKNNNKANDTSDNKSDYYKQTKIHVSVLPAVGYAMATGWAGLIAANISFYTDSNRTKISSATTSIHYSEFKQYWLLCNSNIYLKKLRLNLVGDWRIFKFPTVTYGLGSNNALSDAVNIDYSYLKIHQIVLNEIFPDIFAGIGYHLDYHWDIKQSINSYNMDLQSYGEATTTNSSGFSLNLLYDNRLNFINPQNGFYCNIQVRNNSTFLGSHQFWQGLLIDIRKYFKPSHNSDNVLAFWSYNNFTLNGKPPYLDLPSIGSDAYNNTGRGYTKGRYRGRNLIYLESEYRFSITRNKLFGAVVFVNAESFSEYPSDKFVKIAPAAGMGLRIKLNKVSKTNLAFDYGFGTGGSRGFSITLGEMF